MKRFISITLLYLFAVLLVVLPPEVYKIVTNADIENIEGREIRIAVCKSKTKTNRKIRRLILGDSTGHALYPSANTYNDAVSLACNQAATMAGQYFLLKNYLETNTENLPAEIVLLFTPGTFDNDVDIFAYHYFLKPFPLYEYKSQYTPHLYSRIKSIPFYWTANLPFIQTTNYTPTKAVPAEEERSNLSVLSLEYLLKIDSLARQYGVPYNIRSTPVREDSKARVESILQDLLNVSNPNIKEKMRGYVQTVEYYPSEWFFDDVHLSPAHIPSDYLEDTL
ncbi:MAG: hypothetical protein K6A36_00810 [Paludibacteraceae bacterium]|nr:hypothetical protein [Paludibacteraceae bacterium]